MSGAAYWSGQLARRLEEAKRVQAQRIRALNRVAEGEQVLTEEQRSSLRHSEKRIFSLLAELGEGTTQKARVVDVHEVGSREKPPTPLLEQYELLTISAYGSDPAVSVGDASVVRGIGKRESRTSTGTPEGRGGAAAPATKKFGQANRNVVKSRAAYDMKVKVDRRLRRVAKEISDFLENAERSWTFNVCSHCARIGEDDWKFCPNCGGHMKSEERE